MLRDSVLATVGIIWGAILLLVGGRFLALLLGDNPDSELIERLYRQSDFWVKPFFGILRLANKAVENTAGVFEPASLVAFIVYLFLGAMLLGLLRTSYWGDDASCISAARSSPGASA